MLTSFFAMLRGGFRSTKARQFDRAPDAQMISNIAHDLRTPLTSVRGYLETLLVKGSRLSDAEREECIKIAIRNVDLLTSLVKDLLDLSKMDEPGARCHKESCCVADLIDCVVKKFNPIAAKHGVGLSAVNACGDVLVSMDVKLIERALSNIVHNAIYYSKHGCGVRIDAVLSGPAVSIAVADQGVGISKEDLARLGSRFFRVNRDRSRSSGGSGLGLAIAQRIMEMHGSTLQIQSELGRGTTVAFELKLCSEL